MEPIRWIKVPGGFLAPSRHMSGDVFVLTEDWSDEFLAVLDRPDVVGLRLSIRADWYGSDIQFVASLPPVLRSFELIGWWRPSIDVSPLYAHPELEHLVLECNYKKFDFSRLPALSMCDVDWRRGADTILDCERLRFLSCRGFPHSDLAVLSSLRDLEELRVESRKLETVNGVEALNKLRHVSFIYCTSLADISGLARVPTVETVKLHTCKQVEAIKSLPGLPALRTLHIENCGEVRSVAGFDSARSLEELFLIGISVHDGNLEPLTRAPRLRKVAIAKKRHHSHTSDEIQQALDAKG